MKRRAWIIALIAFAMLFVAMPTRSALAACTSPAGEESKTIYDTTIHAVMYCNGTNWVTVGAGIATGTIAAFASTTCPAGWTEYVAARGRFLRGIDNGAGNDPDGTRVAGTIQSDAFQAHQHNVANTNPAAFDNPYNISGIRYNVPTAAVTTGYVTDGANGTPRTTNETRPKNVAVLFCQYTGAGGGGALPTTNSLDFSEFKDAMALDASTDVSITGTKVLSITNTGTANSLVVNDVASDMTPFVIDASGNVGIGTATPTERMDLGGGNLKMGYSTFYNLSVGASVAAQTYSPFTTVCTGGGYLISANCWANVSPYSSCPWQANSTGQVAAFNCTVSTNNMNCSGICANIR